MLLNIAYNLLLGVPVALSRQVLAGLKDEIDRERLITPQSIKQKLQELQLSLADGQLTEDEYDSMEEVLIDRLKLVQSDGEVRHAVTGNP